VILFPTCQRSYAFRAFYGPFRLWRYKKNRTPFFEPIRNFFIYYLFTAFWMLASLNNKP